MSTVNNTITVNVQPAEHRHHHHNKTHAHKQEKEYSVSHDVLNLGKHAASSSAKITKMAAKHVVQKDIPRTIGVASTIAKTAISALAAI